MILKTNGLQKEYPMNAILSCQNSRNQICRKKRTDKLSSDGSKTEQQDNLTLLEIANPESFCFYDIFEVQDFSFSEQDGKGHLKIQISLLSQYKELQISGQIVDLERESVVAEVSPKTAKDTNQLVVDENFSLTDVDGPRQLGVIAYGDWGNQSLDENELSVFRKANSADADYSYDHIYPKKEASTVILGQLENIWPEPGSAGSPDHIVIALIRKPEDMKDVDYVCGFGRDSRTRHPYLCVPGQGDLFFDVSETPKTDAQHKNSAICKLYRKEGGAAIIAGTEDYGCDQTVSITPLEHRYHYEFVSWKVGYDDSAGWKKTEFDYEMDMIVHTVSTAGGQEEWHPHHLKVSSIPGEANFTKKILPLQIMYGCMAPWTKIWMADGSRKEINRIRIGDMVQGKGDRIMRVTNIWTGPEMEQMVEIYREGAPDTGLFLTKNHPVWVKDELGNEGFQRAGMCRTGDLILVKEEACAQQEGWVRITNIIEKDPCETVYNLDLMPLNEPGHVGAGSMFCEGILTGDNQIQNGLGR